MKTINISLPDELKIQGDKLVSIGEFTTCSELVRVGLRMVIENYQQMDFLKKEVRNWKRINRSRDILK